MIRQAEEFLSTMPSNAQARGEKYFRQRRVRRLEQSKPNCFSAAVQGSDLYDVTLSFESGGWFGECACPLEYDCKHIYAAMKALIARTATPRESDAAMPVTPVAKAKTPHAAEPPNSSFAADVQAACGRALTGDEKRFLTRLQQGYDRCRQRRAISRWDFHELGLHIGGCGWETLHIWPSLPETLREFWVYVAHAAVEHGARLPEFMQSVSNTAEAQERLRRWQRSKEINRWKETLGNSARTVASAGTAGSGCYELRARLTKQGAFLEWKQPGRQHFEPMKSAQARRFREEIAQNSVDLSPGAEWLAQAFLPENDYDVRTKLDYSDTGATRRLRRLFRMPALDALLVNPNGAPFERSTETLQWRLDSAPTENDDYHLRVVRADGSAPPPLLCLLDGSPSLFVTNDTVFHGPRDARGLNAETENIIPAPALETPEGAALLQAMAVELPPRLRERTRVVPLHVVISCVLAPSYPASKSEVCRLQLTAQTDDGAIVEHCHDFSWSGFDRSLSPRKEKRGGPITIYDRNALSDPRQLLAGLDARWEGFADYWAVRVTKKFPEQFTAWLKSLPPAVKLELKGELQSLVGEPVAGRVRLDVTESEIDWFDLSVVLDVADTTLTQDELRLLLNARGAYVRLKSKGWRRLQFNLTEDEDERLARLGLNPRELTAEPQRLHALQLADAAAKKFLPAEQFQRIERRAGEIKARVTPPIPPDIKANLRPYQEDGYHFLAYLAENRFGGILADDMGLGKTLQALTWLAWLRTRVANPQTQSPGLPTLVVCPKSVMDNWRAEAERFAPGLRVKLWHASELNNFSDQLAETDLHVINYSQLRILGEGLANVRWLAAILDEGQYIKNPNSITAQIARSLLAQHRLVLSGTPIENRLLDLWSLMAFAMPGVLGSRAQFAKLYDARDDTFARRRLSARVRPFLLRRTKSQVAKELPDRVEEDLFCEIEDEQRTLYRAELKRAQQMLLRVQTQKQLASERFHFLTSLLRLRQICCHPRLVKADSKATGAKVEALLEQLEPLVEEGHKVLVFSQFVEMLKILRVEIQRRDWPMFYLAGDTENRGELVQAFQNAEGAAVFLISLKAGGFGLNLTAASYVVLFDPWWNPAVENQAIDRTHRIGQQRNVMAYRLLIKDSIEEKIRMLQKQKSALAEDVLGEETFAQRLTLEDLQFLFSDSQCDK